MLDVLARRDAAKCEALEIGCEALEIGCEGRRRLGLDNETWKLGKAMDGMVWGWLTGRLG